MFLFCTAANFLLLLGYKIRVCSVILGKMDLFENYEGFNIIFPID